MGLEELEIRDLDQVTRVYAALLSGHIRLLKLMMPRVIWKGLPAVMVVERNTYVNALYEVKCLMEQSLVRSGFKLQFYKKWSPDNNKFMLGKYVGANTKLAMVHSTVSAITRKTLYYCDTVMSLGWAVLHEATKKAQTLESTIGSSKGKGSSNKMGSNKDIFMYRRSRKGLNLATDVTASVLETCDIMSLPDNRLTDHLHAQQGQCLLGKLREEMSMVTITESTKSTTVTTGGKRSVNGEYTRDDMLSAFLLLCHTRDELSRGDPFIKLCGEVYDVTVK